jgi:uncharacterized protein YkwD
VRRGLFATASLLIACGNAESAPPRSSYSATVAKRPIPSDVTRSPWPTEDESPPSDLTSACGVPDAALARVAAHLADQRARGLGAPQPDAVVAAMRAFGEPHVRPRVLTASGKRTDGDAAVREKLGAMRKASTRCGIAVKETPHGGELLVAVAIEPLADLAPLPTRARTGQWLSLDAKLFVPITGAKLVVTGPRGAPRALPTSLDPVARTAKARFTLDRPGAFTVQLVGDTEKGPLPLLEARVFADVEPEETEEATPGEEAEAGADDASTMTSMIAILRASEGAPPLARDKRLDTIARAHAEHMRERADTAHDLGDGDLEARLGEAGLAARAAGENVAHAATITLAHRALHASPSHRANLLDANYTHLGVGTATADDGTIYVCQIFAKQPR